MKTLILGHDEKIAAWTKMVFGYQIVNYDAFIGILKDGDVVGSILLQGYTGCDIEVGFYGPMSLGIVRQLGRILLDQLGCTHITVRTARNNKTMTKSIKKLGFEFEGVRKNGYGQYDALMYGLYGANLMRLAGRKLQ